LRDVIRRLHGVEATHVESVTVKETFKGQTVWEGNCRGVRSSRPSKSITGLCVGARRKASKRI